MKQNKCKKYDDTFQLLSIIFFKESLIKNPFISNFISKHCCAFDVFSNSMSKTGSSVSAFLIEHWKCYYFLQIRNKINKPAVTNGSYIRLYGQR